MNTLRIFSLGALLCSNLFGGAYTPEFKQPEDVKPQEVFKLEGLCSAQRFGERYLSLNARLPFMSKHEVLCAYPYTFFLYAQIKAFLSTASAFPAHYDRVLTKLVDKKMAGFAYFSKKDQQRLFEGCARLYSAHNGWKNEYQGFYQTFMQFKDDFKRILTIMNAHIRRPLQDSLRSNLVLESQLFAQYEKLAMIFIADFSAILKRYQQLNSSNSSRPIGLNGAKMEFTLKWICDLGNFLFLPTHGGVFLKSKERLARFMFLSQELSRIWQDYYAIMQK